jgi:hypothetical protein
MTKQGLRLLQIKAWLRVIIRVPLRKKVCQKVLLVQALVLRFLNPEGMETSQQLSGHRCRPMVLHLEVLGLNTYQPIWALDHNSMGYKGDLHRIMDRQCHRQVLALITAQTEGS